MVSYIFKSTGIDASVYYEDVVNTDTPYPWQAGNYSLDSYEIRIGSVLLKNPYWNNSSSMYDHGIFTLNGHRIRVRTSAQLTGNNIQSPPFQILPGKVYALTVTIEIDDTIE